MKKPVQMFVATALLAGVAGCAVLTVDVDVYTGPLANTHEVQAEQVISLAMGAKPLLVQLRDHLEVSSRSAYALKTGRAFDMTQRSYGYYYELNELRSNEWYRAGFFSPQFGTDLRLKSVHAIRVNEVLGLYNDRTPEMLAPLIEAGRRALEKYSAAAGIFQGSAFADGQEEKLWQEVLAGASQPKDPRWLALKPWLVSTNARRSEKEFGELVGRLIRGSSERFTTDRNISTTSLCAYLLSAGRISSLDASPIETLAAHLGFRSDKSGTAAKATFVKHTQRVCQAFLDARAARHDLFRTALMGIAVSQEHHFVSDRERASVREAAADVASRAVSASVLKRALAREGSLTSGLRTLLVALDSDLEAGRKHLAIQLANDPALHAQLLALDARDLAAGYAYGLGGGPTSNEELLAPADLQEGVAAFAAAADSALGGGRLQPGLERTIEQYLQAAKELPGKSFAQRMELPQFAGLMDALVAFGQKVVTLGNTSTLLDSGSSESVKKYVHVLQYVGNTILVHVDELKQRAAHQDKLTRRTGWAADAVRTAGFTNQLRNNWVGSTWTNGFNAKDAIEQLTLALRTEHAHLLYQGAGPAKATAITSGTVLFSQPPTNPVVLTNLLSLGVSALTNTSSARLGTDAATAATAQPPPKPPALGELAAAEIDLSRARADEQRADLIATEKRSAHEAAHQKLQTFLKDTKREQADKDARRRLEEAKQKLAELQTHFNEWQTAWRKAAAALTNAEGQLSAATKALAESEAAFRAAIALCTNTATAYQQIEKKNSPEARQAAEAMHKATEAGKVAKARHAAAQSAEAKAKTQLEMAAKHLAAAVSKLNTAAAARNLAQKEAVERQTAANAAKQALETARKDATDLAEAAKNAAKSLSAAESEQKLTRTRRETAEARLAKAKAAALAAVQAGTQPAAADTATSFALSVTNQIIAPGPHEKLKQAIEAVTEIREDMIYLRPAAAYLRSSFPASTANRSTVGWENSLEKQTLRAIPVIGELFDAEGRAHQKILRELDKQSWQSINRVRIAGAGDVNYVVAKDDIGNWYVKSYSADPSNMVRSVKNLAMFSAGGAFGGGRLPIKVGDKQTFAFTNLVFDSQLQQAVANYTRQTTNAFIQLTNDVTGLPGKLINAWKGAGFTNDSSLTALQTAAKTNQFNAALKTPLSDANKAFQDASQDLKASVADEQTVTLLRTVVAYGAALQGDAAGLAEGDQPKAKAAISSTVLSFVTAAARGRAEIITRFEESLGVIQAGARQQSQALGQ